LETLVLKERKKEKKTGYIKTSCEHQSRSVEANTKEINNILMSHDTSQLKKRTVCHKQHQTHDGYL
jgi:hypothetical protein